MSPTSEQILAALLDLTPDLVVLVDPAGQITQFNNACELVTGYRRDEVRGRNLLDVLVPGEWIEVVRQRFIDPYSPEVSRPHENPWLTKSGQERMVRWRCTALKGADGEQPYILGVGTDATEERRIESALRNQSRLLEMFFESTLNCVALLDRDFNFLRVNDPYARACGRRVEEFPGHNHFEFYPSDARAIFEEVVRSKRTFQVEGRPFEYPDHPEWGVTYWDWTLVPVLDDRGEIEVLLFCLNDVTKRKRAEQDLHAALDRLRALSKELVETEERERRRIARELHDEVGQGLTVLRLTLERCLTGGSVDHRVRQALAVTNELVQGVRRIAFDLRPAMLDDLGLVSALLWLVEQYREQAGLDVCLRHGRLRERLAPDLEEAVFRVAQEALTNIIRHAGVLRATVTLSVTEQTVLLRVEDGGRGFDAGAAGAGLRGMRERARMLGGELTIDTAAGAGTVVTLGLPRSDPGSATGGAA